MEAAIIMGKRQGEGDTHVGIVYAATTEEAAEEANRAGWTLCGASDDSNLGAIDVQYQNDGPVTCHDCLVLIHLIAQCDAGKSEE